MPLPAGYTLDTPKLPAGYKLDTPAVAGAGPLGTPQPQNPTVNMQAPPPLTTTQSALMNAGDIGTNLAKGAAKGPLSTITGLSRLINKIPVVGETLAPSSGIRAADSYSQAHGTAQKIGKLGEQVGEFFLPGPAEEAALAKLAPAVGKAAPLVGAGLSALGAGTVNKLQGGTFSGGAAAGAGGAAAGELLPKLAPALQDMAVGKINRKIGALKGDFARGANPGEGYFQARLGPSSSMGSIAEKAAAAREGFGEKIGDAVDNGVLARIGVKIPVQDGVEAIAKPINEVHSVLSGPGGGDTGAVEDLSASFRPAIQKAVQDGGFTPRDYFNIKRNVAKNTSWGDPTQIGLKTARQQIAGGMSGVLGDALPELKPLTSGYQNLTKLEARAADRATTGRPSLSGVGRGMSEVGLAAGGLLKKGPAGILLGAIPAVTDSVPLQTGIASGLYYGGEALPRVAPLLRRLTPPAVLSLRKNQVVDAEQ